MLKHSNFSATPLSMLEAVISPIWYFRQHQWPSPLPHSEWRADSWAGRWKVCQHNFFHLSNFLIRVVLDLPVNPPTSLEGDQFQALAAEAACGLPIQQVLPLVYFFFMWLLLPLGLFSISCFVLLFLTIALSCIIKKPLSGLIILLSRQD